MSKFYHFRQNNSGGSFILDDSRGIGPQIWIEAADALHANARAQNIGIYFDGVDDGFDCPCCGDRWYSVYEDDGEEKPDISPGYDFNWHDTVYIHKLDGTIERVKKPQ